MTPLILCENDNERWLLSDIGWPVERAAYDLDDFARQLDPIGGVFVFNVDSSATINDAESVLCHAGDAYPARVLGLPGGIRGFVKRGGNAEAFQALVEETLAAPEWADEAERMQAERFAQAFAEDFDIKGAARIAGWSPETAESMTTIPRVARLIKQASASRTDQEARERLRRLQMFAEHFVTTGDGAAAVRHAGLSNPEFGVEQLAEHLLALPAVESFVDEARASLAKPDPQSERSDGSELRVINAGDLAATEPPPRPWIVEGWLPSRAVTLIAGDGGTGKSLMVQQWFSALSQGLPFIGVRGVRPVRCLYVNCEDEPGELHRRQVAIAKTLDRQMKTFADDMQMVSRLGSLGNALGSFDQVRGGFAPSALFEAIRCHCRQSGIKVVALDNVAHMYSGNENVRGEVTAFLNLLSRLALEIDGAVILVGHPSKGEGSQYSGSTAWENAVRNRLYLRRPSDDDGGKPENRRSLSRRKSNLASIGDELAMVWHEGAFQPPGIVEAAIGRESELEAIFEACLTAANAQRRNVSHATGSNYAPKLFAAMSQSRGVGRKALAAAMERLFSQGRIVANNPLWFNEGSRRQVHGIAFAAA